MSPSEADTLHCMALIIAATPHALADGRSIRSDLAAHFTPEEIRKHLAAACQKAAVMRSEIAKRRRYP